MGKGMNKDQQTKLWGLLKDIENAFDSDEADAINSKALKFVSTIMAPLQKDKTRLDWLADPSNHLGNVQLPRAAVEANLDSLRHAIDAAMTGDYPKPEHQHQ